MGDRLREWVGLRRVRLGQGDVEVEKAAGARIYVAHSDSAGRRGWRNLRYADSAAQNSKAILSMEILAELPGWNRPERAVYYHVGRAESGGFLVGPAECLPFPTQYSNRRKIRVVIPVFALYRNPRL